MKDATACLRVFIGVITVTSWGKAANHKVALLQGWGSQFDIVHIPWYSITCPQLLLSKVSTLHSALIIAYGPLNITKRQSAALSNALFSLHPKISLFVYFRSNLAPSMSARGAWWQYARGLIKEVATPASLSIPLFYFMRFTISIYWRVYRWTEISIWIS